MAATPVKTAVSDPVAPAGAGQSRWLRTGCLCVVIAAALHSADKPIGGGDTWVAMACGRYTTGPWAANQPDRTWQMRLLDSLGIHITKQDFFGGRSRPFVPGSDENTGWVNQNWLTHVLFYKLKTAWGTEGPDAIKGENLIVVYKFVQAILTALFMYWAARKLGTAAVIAAAVTAFGILLSRSFADMRPNITSIFLAAIMIYLLARWKQGRWKSLAWMIPLMIVWANVHGGFIFAIMVLAVMAGGHLLQKMLSRAWPRTFASIPPRGIVFLLAAAAIITIIPAVCSPFGLENLTHPLIVATGAEGKVWREVQEWLPIYKPGFGNAGPYFYYLGLIGLTFVTWCVLLLRGPGTESASSRRSRRKEHPADWPTIDVPQLAVMAVTLYMSIQSRRFVFLGGVVLAPYLARMIQDIWLMLSLKRRKHIPIAEPAVSMAPSRPGQWRKIAAAATWAAGLAITAIFLAAMWDIYFAPPSDGEQLSVFRRMVGVREQPVAAMQFLNANRIEGMVFNGWENGGFIAYFQDPNPRTGQPRCKVYIDGRAQAAYALEQFQRWKMRNFPPRADSAGKQQIESAYSQKLKDDGVTAVLLRADRSPAKRNARYIYDLLLQSGRWAEVYVDNRFGLLLRIDAPQNQAILQTPVERRAYPDDFSRQFMIGYDRATRGASAKDVAVGLETLLKLKTDVYWPDLYPTVWVVGNQLGRVKDTQAYFLERYRYFKDRIDRGEPFARTDAFQAISQICNILHLTAKNANDPAAAADYLRQWEDYKQQGLAYLEEGVREGWLW